MRHGVVTNGRTTTYYGSAAVSALAQMSAAHTDTWKEAEKKILSSKGAYRQALIDVLVGRSLSLDGKYRNYKNFEITSDLQAKLDATAEQERLAEEKAKQKAVRRHKQELREKLKGKSAKIARYSPNIRSCSLCGKVILIGHKYKSVGKRYAHDACARG